MSKASPGLIKAAQDVFQYLKGTREEGITFFHLDPLNTAAKPKKQLFAYSDASDADDLINRLTTGGLVVFLNGSPISWSTGLQHLTTLSTCKSEYVQAAIAAKEVLYIHEALA